MDDYITELNSCKDETAYLELSKENELHYMKTHSYRFDAILDFLKVFSDIPIKILDIGTTPFTLLIKKEFPNYEVSTLDLTPLLKDRCQRAEIEFRTCNLEKDPIPYNNDYFDLVIFTEVMEHLFIDPVNILKEIRRLLKEKGKLYISVPNIATFRNRVMFLFGVTPLKLPTRQFKKGWVHGHGHIREYTIKELILLLKMANFKVLRKQFLQANPMDALKNNFGVKSRLGGGVARTIYKLFPSFRPCIYCECIKNSD